MTSGAASCSQKRRRFGFLHHLMQFNGSNNIPTRWYMRWRGEVQRDSVALDELRERIKSHGRVGGQRTQQSHLRREPACQRRTLRVLRLLGGERRPDGSVEREHALECIA